MPDASGGRGPPLGLAMNQLPRWLRSSPDRLREAVAVRAAGDRAARILWTDVLNLACACDALAREPDREHELVPLALRAAEQVVEHVPPPPGPGSVAAFGARDDGDVMISTLVSSAGALVAVLTAPADAPDPMPEVARAVHELHWLLGLWKEQAEWNAHVIEQLRVSYDTEPP